MRNEKERSQFKAFAEAIIDPFDPADPAMCALNDWMSEQPATPVQLDQLPTWLRLGWNTTGAGKQQKRSRFFPDYGTSSKSVQQRMDAWVWKKYVDRETSETWEHHISLSFWGRTWVFDYWCYVVDMHATGQALDAVQSLRPIAEEMYGSLLVRAGSVRSASTTRLLLFPPYCWQTGGK